MALHMVTICYNNFRGSWGLLYSTWPGYRRACDPSSVRFTCSLCTWRLSYIAYHLALNAHFLRLISGRVQYRVE